jgi:hypothetical protein
MWNKKPEDMTKNEAIDELYEMKEIFAGYEELGQGISTKETVRYRQIQARLGVLDKAALDKFLGKQYWNAVIDENLVRYSEED